LDGFEFRLEKSFGTSRVRNDLRLGADAHTIPRFISMLSQIQREKPSQGVSGDLSVVIE
jgi:hypothetical protein